jgi:hypothetical protein
MQFRGDIDIRNSSSRNQCTCLHSLARVASRIGPFISYPDSPVTGVGHRPGWPCIVAVDFRKLGRQGLWAMRETAETIRGDEF